MRVYVYIYIYIYIHTSTYIYIYIYIYVYPLPCQVALARRPTGSFAGGVIGAIEYLVDRTNKHHITNNSMNIH